MYKHHKETIEIMLKELKKDDEILGVLLSGSIAHGFEKESSDIDIMIIISEEDYQNRVKKGELTYWNDSICTYNEGYIDGKYISIDFMDKVKRLGSEPARFAFEGAVVLYTKIDGVEQLIQDIVKYPIEKKEENIRRFYAQFEAWKWYCNEAIKHNNDYLLNHSMSNLVLFGGRLILAYNERLYPYHKWFLTVLEEVEDRPKDMIALINQLLTNKDRKSIEDFYECVYNFSNWNVNNDNWPNQFVLDSELNWINGSVSVSDI